MRRGIILLIFLSAIVACRKSSPPQTQPPRKITLAYTPQPNCALVHIAVANGYFAQEGLDVRPLMHTYGKAALQSMLEGKADLATVAETAVRITR
ncbi:MAG TPA: ABC transporter substrate-binding protein [Desulfuromonadaceae bacterium]